MNAKHLMTAACLAGVAACAGNAPSPAGQADAAKTVQRKFTAFDQHDAAAIQDVYGVDAVLHSPDYPELKGNGPISGTYRQLFAAIPDAKDEVQSFDVIGDKVYVQFVLTGHWSGAADKPVHARIMSIYTVADGHIVADTTYYDRKAP
jgi:ketosteroid isomerase-like protein